MKRFFLLIILSVLTYFNAFSQENIHEKKKILNGYDGGMMLHAGYISTYNHALNITQKGVTKGIGGAIRFHLGSHYRIGTEGYVSTLGLMDNHSYIKTFWAGLLNDFYWRIGKFMPYAGVTVGGGTLTNCLIFEGTSNDWDAESKVIFKKDNIIAIDPFIGCDYCISEAMHLTFKIDFLTNWNFNKSLYFPTGPRFYIGFIFFH